MEQEAVPEGEPGDCDDDEATDPPQELAAE
jgi:hypothetical protein